MKTRHDGADMKRVIAAIVFAALPAVLWWWAFLGLAAHYASVPAYGYSGAWDFPVYFALGTALVLTAAIAAVAVRRQQPGALVVIAVAALFALLPYVMMMGGGV